MTTTADYNLNDGEYHHIAISMPSKSCLNSDVKMFVNGKLVRTSWNGKNENVFFVTSGKLSLGGFGYSNNNYDSVFPDKRNFAGTMDNFIVWGNTPMTQQRLLRRGFKTNFENNVARCKSSQSRTFRKTLLPAKICKKRCLKQPECWGYELRNRKGNLHLCILHYGTRPKVIDASTQDDRCNPVVR